MLADGEKERKMRWIVLVVALLVLIPLVFKLIAFLTGVAFGLIHLAILLAVVIFLVGLVRQLMVRM
jgi:hypothetical protein